MIIYPIVEGHGEVIALPLLLRRLSESLGHYDTEVLRPHRIPRGRILHGNDLERAAEVGRRRIREYEGEGAIVVLLDADDECAAEVAYTLKSRLVHAGGDIPAYVVLPVREYEAWLLAAARSLRTSSRVAADAEPPADPEGLRGAKEYLAGRILLRGVYSETVDQAALTAVMSLEEARSCRSFEKLYQDMASLLSAER